MLFLSNHSECKIRFLHILPIFIILAIIYGMLSEVHKFGVSHKQCSSSGQYEVVKVVG